MSTHTIVTAVCHRRLTPPISIDALQAQLGAHGYLTDRELARIVYEMQAGAKTMLAERGWGVGDDG